MIGREREIGNKFSMTLKISPWMDNQINYALVDKCEQAIPKWSRNFPDSGPGFQLQQCLSLAVSHDTKLSVLKAHMAFVFKTELSLSPHLNNISSI